MSPNHKPSPLIKTLTVRNPYALAIFTSGKDVENRDWFTMIRGRIAIHAASTMTQEEYSKAARFMMDIGAVPPTYDACMGTLGLVLGSVRMYGCSKHVPSKWYTGEWGFLLRDPQQLDQKHKAKGQLGFWGWKAPDGVTM